MKVEDKTIMNTLKSTFSQIINRKETYLSLVILIAGIALLGWVFNNVSLAAFSSSFKPISPIVAVTFIAVSILLLIKINSEKSRLTKIVVTFSIIIITLFFSAILLGYFFNFEFKIEKILVKNLDKYGSSQTGIMSQVASGLFIAICISILAGRNNNKHTIKYFGGSLLLLAFSLSSLLLIGYLLRAPLLFGSNIIPVALPTAICFWLLSITLLREIELKYWTFNWINKDSTEFILLKSFLPFAILIVITQGFLITIFTDANSNPALSIAIVLLIIIPITILIVIKISSILGVTLLKAQQALKEKENKLLLLQYSRNLIEVSLDPFVTIDADGKITDANSATENASGLSREILIGSDFSEYFTEPDKARIVYQRVFAEGSVIDYPLTIRHRSTKLIDVLYNASVYRNENGEIIGVFAAARDITKIKHAEEILEIANNELSFQIKETAKQAEELFNANKELAFQNEEKQKRADELIAAIKELETFSYSVSHDLRSPLRHINGFVDLLLNRFSDSLPDKAKHYLNNIADSTTQMGILIDDLLQFSRIGRQEKKLAIFDMNTLVHEVLVVIKQENNKRNIDWRIAMLPLVYGDQGLLRLVWTNLISNAVKFTSTREKAIIEIKFLDEKDEFTFSISDNGVGFDMQYAQNLFGVFQRLHTTDEFEGTGIGLANVQHIILRLRGRTWAEAELDKGATFYFSLPKNKED